MLVSVLGIVHLLIVDCDSIDVDCIPDRKLKFIGWLFMEYLDGDN